MEPYLQLQLDELRHLTRAVGDLGALQSMAPLQSMVFATLDKIAPGCVISNDELVLNPDRHNVAFNTSSVFSEAQVQRFAEAVFAGGHPYVEYFKRGGTNVAMRPIDLLPESDYRSGFIYNEIYRVGGVPYAMFSMLPTKGPRAYINFAQLRDREFSVTEQALTRLYMEEVRKAVDRLYTQSGEMEKCFVKNSQALQLTPREQDIMLLVFQGRTDKEIAVASGTSCRTVSGQIGKLFQKLGVHTRGGAVRRILDGSPSFAA